MLPLENNPKIGGDKNAVGQSDTTPWRRQNGKESSGPVHLLPLLHQHPWESCLSPTRMFCTTFNPFKEISKQTFRSGRIVLPNYKPRMTD
jgi:hypothetical protein